ncbi:alpha/beta hydrolase family protein [Rhodanobacter terrae]|uniref:Alpha/beta hydrolase family protein n=1 Tax=Rhodanobacter terrae TaxID=418647 RepID=A0ABW0SZV4_9GAMM
MKAWASFVLLLAIARPAAWAQDASGDWIGHLPSGFRVLVHIDKVGHGYSGVLINPSDNQTPLDDITANGRHLHFGATALGLGYDGDWDAGRKAWHGQLTFQKTYPLDLHHATDAELYPAPPKRPQEAAIQAGPRPYTSRDVLFPNQRAHVTLAGTLSVPSGKGPFPAVVLVSGTGHNTRDETVWNHQVFLVLADALNRAGVAVLRYDKRGVGGSSGDYDAATTADFASDADAAVAWLRRQPGIDANRIGVLGHSEGGVIAPMVADRDPNVAFVVTIAGPAIRGDRLFVLQSAMTAKAYGAPDEYIARRKLFDQRLYDAIIAAPSAQAARKRADALVAQGIKDKTVDPNEAKNLATDVTSSWERYFLAYDPAPALRKLTVPILALNGSLDLQVPAQDDLVAMRQALAHNPHATIVEMPGMNHLLQDAKTGAPNEYNGIEETMSPRALNLICDWVKRWSRSSKKG